MPTHDGRARHARWVQPWAAVTFDVTWPLSALARPRTQAVWKHARMLAGGRGVRKVRSQIVRGHAERGVTVRYTFQIDMLPALRKPRHTRNPDRTSTPDCGLCTPSMTCGTWPDLTPAGWDAANMAAPIPDTTDVDIDTDAG